MLGTLPVANFQPVKLRLLRMFATLLEPRPLLWHADEEKGKKVTAKARALGNADVAQVSPDVRGTH